jgi:hypothetical protein
MQSDYDRDENHTLAATEEKFPSNQLLNQGFVFLHEKKKRISFKDIKN